MLHRHRSPASKNNPAARFRLITISPTAVTVAVVAVILVAILVYSLSHMDQSSNFRLRRIQVWLHPEDYASGDGYQTLQALYAIGSGGFFGRGLGNSIQKLGSVPEAQNDMIFSIICEELGIFGAIMVLALFGYLLYRLFLLHRMHRICLAPCL